MLRQGFERCDGASRILLAIAAAQADAADHLAIDHDRETAHEHRKAALEAPLDAKSLIAGKRWAVRCLVEEMRRALVAGGGECLVPGDLRTGNSRAVHALDQEGMASVICDADGFQNLDLLSLRDGRRRHQPCLGALELEYLSHVWVSSAFEVKYRD